MTRSFVFVDQTFTGLTVHNWLHCVECILCSFFVTSCNSRVYLLDKGTHH